MYQFSNVEADLSLATISVPIFGGVRQRLVKKHRASPSPSRFRLLGPEWYPAATVKCFRKHRNNAKKALTAFIRNDYYSTAESAVSAEFFVQKWLFSIFRSNFKLHQWNLRFSKFTPSRNISPADGYALANLRHFVVTYVDKYHQSKIEKINKNRSI